MFLDVSDVLEMLCRIEAGMEWQYACIIPE